MIGPGFVTIDASLVKSFALGGSRTLQVRIEAFNLSNRTNFAIPSGRSAFTGVAADGSPVIAPTWGRIVHGDDVAADSGGGEGDVLTMHRFVEVSQDRRSLSTRAKGPGGTERITLRTWERVRRETA